MSRDDAFEAWKRRAKERDILEVASSIAKASLRKKDREWVGACPVCPSTSKKKNSKPDGFAINPAKQIYICRRGGGAGGDVIAMVMHCCAVDFMQACEMIVGEPPPAAGSAITEETRRRAEQLRAEAAEIQRRRDQDDNIYRQRERHTVFDIDKHAHPFEGSSVAGYLTLRGLRFPPTPEGRAHRIKCVESMPYHHNGTVVHRGPAMVLRIVDEARVFRGLHFTYLDLSQPRGKLKIADPDDAGEELDPKKSRGSVGGNKVDLIGPKDPTQLVIGEGFEKTVAVWMALESTGRDLSAAAFWSACNLGNLAGKASDKLVHPDRNPKNGRIQKVAGIVPDLDAPAIAVPDSVTDLVLLGDTTSEPFNTRCAMARACARYARPGRTVRVAWAPDGVDFDDLLFDAKGDDVAIAAVLERIAGIVDQAQTYSGADLGSVRDRAGAPLGDDQPGADKGPAPVEGAPHVSPAASVAGPALPPAAAAIEHPPDAPARAPLSAVAASSPPSHAGGSGGKQPPEKGGGAGGGDELNRKLAWLPQTDLGNVERFVARYGDVLKWCMATGWHYWDGKRWSRKGAETFVLRAEHATVRAIQDEAKAIAGEAVELVPLIEPPARGDGDKVVDLDAARAKKKAARETAKARKKKAEGLAELAKSLRAWGRKSETSNKMSLAKRARANMEVHHEAFDADPWKINVQNGTLVVRRPADVPAGEALIVLQPHDPLDYITKISPVNYDPAADCPLFDSFFARVQPHERQRRFLMQWHGYSLTGDAEEQKLAVYWGSTGQNGKGTLMETCAFIGGDYAESVPIDTFLQSTVQKSGGQATPDLAKLPGVRFLRTGEPDKGAKLGEGLIKKVTGGDPIDARNLNKEFFTFFAQFKLTVACNHKPRISGTDGGIWRRMILVPFLVQVPEAERDPQLKAKLRLEGSGILNRLLDGLRDYLENGLVLGDEIVAATAKYREDSDAVGRFLDQCTVVDPAGKTQSSVLWETYLAWAKCNDGPNYSNKGFSGILDDRGIEKRQISVMFWIGIRLIKSVNDFVDNDGKPLRQSASRTDDAGNRTKGDDDEPLF